MIRGGETKKIIYGFKKRKAKEFDGNEGPKNLEGKMEEGKSSNFRGSLVGEGGGGEHVFGKVLKVKKSGYSEFKHPSAQKSSDSPLRG